MCLRGRLKIKRFDMASIEALADTLRSVATVGMKPKELLASVRERHPEVTKKEVVRAAFYALTENHGVNHEHAKDLHSFAITERAFDDDEPVKRSKLRKKKKDRKAVSERQPAH
jgi:hypothetical protein